MKDNLFLAFQMSVRVKQSLLNKSMEEHKHKLTSSKRVHDLPVSGKTVLLDK